MLITTTQELQDFAHVSIDLDILSITPAIRSTERTHIIPRIGLALYREVLEAQNAGSLSERQEELLSYINAATAPLALYEYSKTGGVMIDNSGIYKLRNDQRWNLSEGEQKQLMSAFLLAGINALEDLLQYLETHLSHFSTYSNSEERKRDSYGLVTSSDQLRVCLGMLHPRMTFHAMREALRFTEDIFLSGLLQPSVYNRLATAPTDQDKPVLELARKATIYLAMSRALLTRTVKLTMEGIQVMLGERGQVSDAENQRIQSTAKTYEDTGKVYLEKLESLLRSAPPAGYVAPVIRDGQSGRTPDRSKIVLM